MKSKVCIALGGNALQRAGDKGTDQELIHQVEATCIHFVELIKEGFQLIVTHGNGPQVGNILLQNEYSKDKIPSMPLDICGAESQGMIGYLIQQRLSNHLKKAKIKLKVITICTQTLVEKSDPAFKKPTKPIGPFYTEKTAKELEKANGWDMIEQTGKGFRRVVPSPHPAKIIEAETIETLTKDHIVIACGGGGIPVVMNQHNQLEGVEAVIDKDRTASVLAKSTGCDTLMILTDVEKVAINFGTPQQKNLSNLTVEEAKAYHKNGEFGVGSMGPKVEAAWSFILNGGKKAIITSLEMALEALKGKTGTVITK